MNEFDDDFLEKEINLIDRIIEASLRKNQIVGEKELRVALKK
ncbi:MAG: hypothetical protein AABY04_04065 [Candidatus Micrarchaeota archaeon]